MLRLRRVDALTIRANRMMICANMHCLLLVGLPWADANCPTAIGDNRFDFNGVCSQLACAASSSAESALRVRLP